MVGEVFSCDNSGNRVPPDPSMANPVAASGVKLDAGRDTDGTVTVVGGQSYIVTTTGNSSGRWMFSITGVLTTNANVEWIIPQQGHVIIKIPQGVTTLYYLQKEQNGHAYMRTLKPEN